MMGAKIIILVCFLLAGITAQADDTLPQGRWEVTQVTIEKNTDGNIKTTVYNAAADVKSSILCPQEWEINAQNIVLHYPNGVADTVKNTLENGQLLVFAFDGVLRTYLCSVNDGELILTATHNYLNLSPGGQAEKIVEKWVIIMKKQK